ncbi:alpha/beta hydrolase [Halobaculum magnesiiphilum]|uniref:Dienelactone hydrolase family protein n=1 Tax=Halobaculum magnesiiphilum TaxID=1017351 RepID=A0A8T8WHS4_9EURY|nr:dienelactone hydrolase family protein [Halobaculum magnesiiphilum]QZP39336.1 dienelactone hydrolase family protein [Halobaculum magnesiiphilum]
MSDPFTVESRNDPHGGQPLETAGAPREAADAVVVLLHGRSSTAKHILRLVDEFHHHGVMYLAPQAARRTWYPRSGYLPFEANEPWFSSALDRVAGTLDVAAAADVPPERTLLLGFSQGGCLASELVARNSRRYGGLVVLSGSLLGPETSQEYEGSIDGTSVFLGCSTDDPYVAADRIHETARVFEQLDGDVTSRLYDGLGHAINDDEMQMINTLVEQLV